MNNQHQLVSQLLHKDNYNSEILNTFTRYSQDNLKLLHEYNQWISLINEQVILSDDLLEILDESRELQNKTLQMINKELSPKIQAYMAEVTSLINSSKSSFRTQPRYRYHKITKFLDLNA
ncbi:hypothetical protein PVA45_06480 [Entomospira entomophila]|uniref:Uncharacterized protein n=1 Tax=Entomospira entomophila TaxID=2719988 RepID=A0A968KWT5_9SPIO|nr:hypothetical protein [Entomospira entomophilus]NIZ41145.1 hypothetical protein [Entomospira entomophilus]WDI35352.1 hypothetical protein PVA45_06480 [Entomospira entomophilus]